MSQQLDDVTGDPIRLSSRERERERQATIAMINAQTVQINTLTAAVRELRSEAHHEYKQLWALIREHEARLDRLSSTPLPWYRRAWARLLKGW